MGFRAISLTLGLLGLLKGKINLFTNRAIFFEKNRTVKINKSLYLRAPKELDAHTLCIRSTHQYFGS